jgi:transcriptional regulator with XRE-family HTH domain
MLMENCYNLGVEYNRERFVQFINDAFYDWRGNTDRRWVDFAEYVGVSQQTMASWKNGYLKRPPDPSSSAKLVARFGQRAYDALGLPTPEADLSPEELAALGSALSEIRGIDPDTEAGLRRILDILERHRLTVKSIK